MTEVVIEPVTRIEGHLSVKIKVEEGKVVDAYTVGELWRGLERIVLGRDPRDAPVILARICGVCHETHNIASVHAIESAVGFTPPDNAMRIRNIIECIQEMWDHVAHLTVLAGPDYAVYGLAGKHCLKLKQPPWAPPSSTKSANTSTPCLELDLDRYYALLHKVVLLFQKLCHEAMAIFGGRVPFHTTILPGGVTVTPLPSDLARAYAKMREARSLINEVYDYVWNVFVPHMIDEHPEVVDLLTNIGVGVRNFLAYGVCPVPEENYDPFIKGGVIIGGSKMDVNFDEIVEYVKHSYYTEASGGKPSKAPPPEPFYDKPGAYSWIKAPRYRGEPCEVGPLARMLINQKYKPLSKHGASLLDRILARLEEAKLFSEAILDWILSVVPKATVYDPKFEIKDGEGFGTWEPPRGALLHFIRIRGGKTAAYQCVVPTTWNCSPRDDVGKRGPMEEALINTPVPFSAEGVHEERYDVINAVRIVRSFDPCLACSVHLITPKGEISRISISPL